MVGVKVVDTGGCVGAIVGLVWVGDAVLTGALVGCIVVLATVGGNVCFVFV